MADHGIARDQLRAFIERIERLEEEKAAISEDIKEVYAEGKGSGFDTKIMRMIIRIRKQDRNERAEQEALLDMYLQALGMAPDPGPDGDDDGPRGSRPQYDEHRAMPEAAPRDFITEPSQAHNDVGSEQAAASVPLGAAAEIDAPETATRSDQTSKSTAVHIDAGKTGVTAGETAPPFQSSDLHDGRLQAGSASALDESGDSATGAEASVAPFINTRCLKAQRGEFCKFADKAYSCAGCIQADLQTKARVA